MKSFSQPSETNRFIDSIGLTEEQTEPYLDYLDELRDSNRINMLGAHRFLMSHFDITNQQARAIFAYWQSKFLLKGESE